MVKKEVEVHYNGWFRFARRILNHMVMINAPYFETPSGCLITHSKSEGKMFAICARWEGAQNLRYVAAIFGIQAGGFDVSSTVC